MRISVTAIEQQEENIIVICDLGIGMLKGIWKGKKLPVLNASYYVEFTLDDINYKHVKILPKSQEDISVTIKNNTIFFAGICEDYDGEVYYIRFEDDWLEMLCIEEDSQTVHVDDNILFWIDYHQVLIFPYDMPKKIVN
ncbi:MAG: hypothetical protein K2H93_05130 [Oscillospiraceae bacterium]|nr:hypothetical protein [Oscillospiraceae bacterium]